MGKEKVVLKFLEKKYGKDIKISKKQNQKIYELLIETILSQRNRDESTEKVAKKLFSNARTPKQIMKLSRERLQTLIRTSGPYKQKAKKIRRTTRAIIEKYNGKVPSIREELMSLYGVGPKTADIVLMYGFNIPSIAVDTHCNRVPKRIGLVDRKANVEEVKHRLEEIFPKNKWYLINLGFVTFGKNICKPTSPVCKKDKKSCPFSDFCRAFKQKDFKV
ncbi:MAG: endonuclease III [Candidatus Aenigmarchaeota archaeon]|nr:endonuclease III [Candidatus Aenigmarchaeota archaeon]